MLPTKFRFIWLSGFRRGFFFKSTNQKQELPLAAMLVHGPGQNEQSLQRTFHRCFLPSFGSFGYAVSEKTFQKLANQKQELPVAAMFINGSGRNVQSAQRNFEGYFLARDSYVINLSRDSYVINLSCNSYVINLSCDSYVINLSCDSYLINLSHDSYVINLSCDSYVISLSRDSYVINLSRDSYVINLCDSYVINLSCDRYVINLSHDSYVINLT